MNLSSKKNKLVVFVVSFLFLFFIITAVSTVEAGKGHRRAAGFASKGRASSGSIKTQKKAYNKAKRNARDNRSERREDIRDYKKERREDRYDYRDERRERWEDRRTVRRIVGAAALSAVAYRSLRCRHENVFIDGFTYSRCGNKWYEPVHRGGDVTYIIVETPYGY